MLGSCFQRLICALCAAELVGGLLPLLDEVGPRAIDADERLRELPVLVASGSLLPFQSPINFRI